MICDLFLELSGNQLLAVPKVTAGTKALDQAAVDAWKNGAYLRKWQQCHLVQRLLTLDVNMVHE